MARSATQRTLNALRKRGLKCAIVEKWNQFVGEHGIRQDLFGIIDVLALDPVVGVIGVQTTTGNSFNEHVKKIMVDNYQDTYDWLTTPGTSLELWGWRKVKKKRGGKAMVWKPRVGIFFVKDDEVIFEEKK